MLAWIGRTWRGELGVARSTLLLSGLGAFTLGSLADSGMEAGITARGFGYLLFAVSDLAIAFALLQSVLMLGDVGLYSLAAAGLAPSPADFIAGKLAQLNAIVKQGG